MALAADRNVRAVLSPSRRTELVAAMMIKASMTAYSTAVGPLTSRMNRRSRQTTDVNMRIPISYAGQASGFLEDLRRSERYAHSPRSTQCPGYHFQVGSRVSERLAPFSASWCALQPGGLQLTLGMLWSARQSAAEYLCWRIESELLKNLALAFGEPSRLHFASEACSMND
jgi:hypothetical protein